MMMCFPPCTAPYTQMMFTLFGSCIVVPRVLSPELLLLIVYYPYLLCKVFCVKGMLDCRGNSAVDDDGETT